ncbi:MAG: hypothetical protein V3T09_07145 [bacterium]
MKYPRILCALSIFIFMGIGVTGIKHVGAASFESFKPADDPGYTQRHNGNIEWHLFHDSAESNGDEEWQQRIKDAEGTSRLIHLTPAKVAESKYQSPCPLCEDPTYFWLKKGDLDSDTELFIKGDYPDWNEADGVCRNCFECYELRSGKYYDGNPVASSTDEYVIGYNKSPRVLDYFKNVK